MKLKLAAALGVLAAAVVAVVAAGASGGAKGDDSTTTPIKHLVVVYQENVSFDHYFATYPLASDTDGTPFEAKKGTPSVNGLGPSLQAPNNPNSAQPFRLSHEQAQTCDQDHGYRDEQLAFDGGLMDKFVETVGRGGGACADYGHGKGLVMGYYDGNTVTALWNYAQSFAMSDNSYSSTFGPSTPGAINLVAGQTHGFAQTSSAVTTNGTIVGDPQPAGDRCDSRDTTTSTDPANRNIGDLLNAKGVTWGWFQGGFADCNASHADIGGVVSKDYIPHHEPFQYYPSTANPQHLPPTSAATIGHQGDRANHQYDLKDFWAAVDAHNMPAVSFLKAAAYQDGHAGYSTPLDEQRFLVETIDRLEQTEYWHDTAVVIAYDDSDGWYDHQPGPIVNQSPDSTYNALAEGACGQKPDKVSGGYLDRCGYGPRQPLLVISPYARSNFVDHTVTDQSSILRFVEDNWQTGRIGNTSFDERAGSLDNLFSFDRSDNGPGKLFLDPATGARR